MEQSEKFDSWAIVEVFGHAKFAGRVTEQAIGGASFVRVDVPAVDKSPAFTKLFGASAIYSITPVEEELARKAVKACHSEPISVYIPEERQITGPNIASVQPCKHNLYNCEACNQSDEDHDCKECGGGCDCGEWPCTGCMTCVPV
jgi:hypothetical protein